MESTRTSRRRTLPEPPPDRGELLTPAKAAAHPKLFNGIKSAKWVLKNVKQLADGRRIKVKLGHATVAYYYEDVREWIAQRQTQ
jgi:hypothetical protein